jgi:hypothetical protein
MTKQDEAQMRVWLEAYDTLRDLHVKSHTISLDALAAAATLNGLQLADSDPLARAETEGALNTLTAHAKETLALLGSVRGDVDRVDRICDFRLRHDTKGEYERWFDALMSADTSLRQGYEASRRGDAAVEDKHAANKKTAAAIGGGERQHSYVIRDITPTEAQKIQELLGDEHKVVQASV